MRAILYLGILGTACVSSQALAFGASGHEAVCEIAYRELNPEVRNRIDGLIALDNDPSIRTFRDSCVWADFRGATQNARRIEHYVNVPRYWTSIHYERCYQIARCLFTAIDLDLDTLQDPVSSQQAKLRALKFLGHWVGDIHQPLHISYEDDSGGNDILVEGVAGCARNGEMKLHAVWDTCIPEDIMQELNARSVSPNDDDREAFGALLWQAITPAQRTAWQTSRSPLAWANESYEIARRSEVGYCIRSGAVCQYAEDSEEYESNIHAENDGMRIFEAPNAYEDDFGPTVTARLQAAGVRLGAMLNRAFGG